MIAQKHRKSSIEPLESRIAPALLVVGANLLGGDAPKLGESSVGETAVVRVKMLSGQAVVWYDGESITSISVGPGAKLEIAGDVKGDIIGNLTKDGELSDSDGNPLNGNDGGVLLDNDLLGVTTRRIGDEAGSIGRIITGGNISNIEVTGKIQGIYAGDGVFRAESTAVAGGSVESSVSLDNPVEDPEDEPSAVDVNPLQIGVQRSFFLLRVDAEFQPGAGISNLNIEIGESLQVFAGSGSRPDGSISGVGANGGSVSNVSITTAFARAGSSELNSYRILGGDGGMGNSGGKGGDVSSIFEEQSSTGAVINGGNGGVGTSGAGGKGGSVANLDLQSSITGYVINGGLGGSGAPGGAGGGVQNVSIINLNTSAGVILVGQFGGGGSILSNPLDILVSDSSTGDSIVYIAQGDGTYQPLVQYISGTTPVFRIPSQGTTPVSGAVADLDNDGFDDFILTYRDSQNVGFFLNRGAEFPGVFIKEGAAVANGFRLGVSAASSVDVVYGSEAPTVLVGGNVGQGSGVITKLIPKFDENDKLASYVIDASLSVPFEITDVAVGTANTTVFDLGVIATRSGDILDLQQTVVDGKTNLTVKSVAQVIGGIDDIELDALGVSLLVVSKNSRIVATFDAAGPASDEIEPFSVFPTGDTPHAAHFIKRPALGIIDPDINPILVVTSSTASTKVLSLGLTLNTLERTYTLFDVFDAQISSKLMVPLSPSAFVLLDTTLSSFEFSPNFQASIQVPLPFAAKTIAVTGGDGGQGLTIGSKIGKGGVGGSIFGINGNAARIDVFAGNGGDSQMGTGGAGGSFTNPESIVTVSKVKVPSVILNGSSLVRIGGGHGGSTLAEGKNGAGGAGGNVVNVQALVVGGEISVISGDGGDGRGGVGGKAGSLDRLKLKIDNSGDVFVESGAGGKALSGKAAGGAGGAITFLNYTLNHIEVPEQQALATVIAGDGGESFGGVGGAGGAVKGGSLLMDGASQITPGLNSTINIAVFGGNGGKGASGGIGGDIQKFTHETLYDQIEARPEGIVIIIDPVIMTLAAGNGGEGTTENGGNGGSVLTASLSGVTFSDEDSAFLVPLRIFAGDAGDGAKKGGKGGNVVGVTAQNSRFQRIGDITRTHLVLAEIFAGNGGNGGVSDGGAGGIVKDNLIATAFGMHIVGGNGGIGGASVGATSGKGGAGGDLINNEFGSVSSAFQVSMLIEAGDAGQGVTRGGLGGSVNTLRVNTPQDTESKFVAIQVFAGQGGAATGSGALGGNGGDITGLSQLKDINSSLNLLMAGNGGASPQGSGGDGGDVTNVKTPGLLGRVFDSVEGTLGVFDNTVSSPQGVFSGRGGTGQTSGDAGSISNITARVIAAMSAAPDDLGIFAKATKISNVKTLLIGFEAGTDGVFTGGSPDTVRPVDGFILAKALSSVTGTRTGYTFVG